MNFGSYFKKLMNEKYRMLILYRFEFYVWLFNVNVIDCNFKLIMWY